MESFPNLSLDERSLMTELNFTDEMYEFIVGGSNEERSNSGTDDMKQIPCVAMFHSIGGTYKSMHGYIALMVCFFGTITNVLNLLILKEKELRTPINLILMALAGVDVMVMIEYVPFALHMYILDSHFSYAWAVFVLFHSQFTQLLHTISIQLTLSMAIWRYVAIRFTNHYQVNVTCTFQRCYWVIFGSFVGPLFICIPNYLMFSIVKKHGFHFKPNSFYSSYFGKREAENLNTLLSLCRVLGSSQYHQATNSTKNLSNCADSISEAVDYMVDISDLAKANGGTLHIIHFWTFSVIVKLLPCVILTFFMAYLVHTLYGTKRRQKVLYHYALPKTASIPLLPIPLEPQIPADIWTDGSKRPRESMNPIPKKPNNNNNNNLKKWRKTSTTVNMDEHLKKGTRRSERTSRMLVAILCLFLLTEFPQGIMALLSGLYGTEFFRKCYNSFAEIWDLLALLNSSINFILYCSMSKLFRIQFIRKFCQGWQKKGGAKGGEEYSTLPKTNFNHHKNTFTTSIV